MGRKKLEMKKIENIAKRNITYAKRRNGLLKKAFELSTVCDVDIGLIMFSPSGKLTHFTKDDKIEEVILRFCNTPQHERTQQTFETLKDLNKVIPKLHNEEGLEGPRMNNATLQLENQQLRATLEKMYQEKAHSMGLYEEGQGLLTHGGMETSNLQITGYVTPSMGLEGGQGFPRDGGMETPNHQFTSYMAPSMGLEGGQGFPTHGGMETSNLEFTNYMAYSMGSNEGSQGFPTNGGMETPNLQFTGNMVCPFDSSGQGSVPLPNQGNGDASSGQGSVPLPNQGNGDASGNMVCPFDSSGQGSVPLPNQGNGDASEYWNVFFQ